MYYLSEPEISYTRFQENMCMRSVDSVNITQNCIFMMKSTPGHMWLDLCGQPCEAVQIQAVNSKPFFEEAKSGSALRGRRSSYGG